MFTQNDLELGYVVKLRNGNVYVVERYVLTKTSLENRYHKAFPKDLWEWDLKSKLDKNLDIVEVYGYIEDEKYLTCQFFPTIEHRELIWRRQENPIKMTKKEIEDALGYKIEIAGEK